MQNTRWAELDTLFLWIAPTWKELWPETHLNVSDEGHGDPLLKLVQRRVEVQDFHDLHKNTSSSLVRLPERDPEPGPGGRLGRSKPSSVKHRTIRTNWAPGADFLRQDFRIRAELFTQTDEPTCWVVRAVHSEQMASASWDVFFLTCSSWAAWMTGSRAAAALLWNRLFPRSHSSIWLVLYLSGRHRSIKWCDSLTGTWLWHDITVTSSGCDTWAACRCSRSRRLCAAAGCWGWWHWCSGRAAGSPGPRSQGPVRGPAWWCGTGPAAGSGPAGCSWWGRRRPCPCWTSGSCSPSASRPPGWGCSRSPTWPTLEGGTETESERNRQRIFSKVETNWKVQTWTTRRGEKF